jgi:hypothetical protein
MSYPYNKPREVSGYNLNFSLGGDPSPVNYDMGDGIVGSYSGIRLKPRGVSTWRKYPNDAPLLQGKLFTPQGAGVPLHPTNAMEPPKNSMFLFARNIASPACCPSTYSTDRGCICSTPYQRRVVSLYRGGNKTQIGDDEY